MKCSIFGPPHQRDVFLRSKCSPKWVYQQGTFAKSRLSIFDVTEQFADETQLQFTVPDQVKRLNAFVSGWNPLFLPHFLQYSAKFQSHPIWTTLIRALTFLLKQVAPLEAYYKYRWGRNVV